MRYLPVVVEAAKKLRLLDGGGQLKTLDSAAVVDLVVTLEEVAEVEIPLAQLKIESFASVETIAKLLEDLKPSA